MRYLILIFAAPAVLATAIDAGAQNALTAAEKAEGWTLLFDGTTTTGWRGYNQTTCPDGWRAVDGALTRVAKAGDIVTTNEYGSFDFRFEWRIAKNGNSGVFYRVIESPELKNAYLSGPEYQVLDNAGHPDGKNGPDRFSAANYALQPPSKDTTRPIGEWNEGRIVIRGNRVEHWLNGVKVVEYELGSAAWKAQVAASKFNTMPKYGTAARGRIALQDHGDEVAFRNLRIKVLE